MKSARVNSRGGGGGKMRAAATFASAASMSALESVNNEEMVFEVVGGANSDRLNTGWVSKTVLGVYGGRL